MGSYAFGGRTFLRMNISDGYKTLRADLANRIEGLIL